MLGNVEPLTEVDEDAGAAGVSAAGLAGGLAGVKTGLGSLPASGVLSAGG